MCYNLYMKRNLYISIIFILLILLGIFFVSTRQQDQEEKAPDTDTVQEVAITQKNPPTEQCFYRITTKTEEKPFSVEEFMRLEFDGEKVTGMKFGFQDGPGYSNGYTGTLSGTQTPEELVLYYAYTVEGSSNTEQEIYKMTNTGIERLQYQLIEKNNMLVPDRSSLLGSIPYTSFSCADFAEKVPK